MTDGSLQTRVIELEIQLAHAQRMMEQLNEVVTEQSSIILGLKQSLTKTQSQIEELKSNTDSPLDPFDEKPPHY